MNNNRKVFLIQVSGETANHGYLDPYKDGRSYADEVLKHNYYMQCTWHERERDSDFGKVSEGDLILVYFTGSVNKYPQQIGHIYKVSKFELYPKEK